MTRVVSLVSALVALYCVALQVWPSPELDQERLRSVAAEYVRTHLRTATREVDARRPLEGVVVVITGATSGIGASLAATLHDLGATVVAIGRSQTKLARLETELRRRRTPSGGGGGDVVSVTADLADLNSVAAAANEIRSKFRDVGVDFLVNNAGVHYNLEVFNPFANVSTAQGHDLVFGVNYLSHFLLADKLLPLLESSRLLNGTRIVQMSSSYHFISDGTDLMADGDDGPPLASVPHPRNVAHKHVSYGTSKLAQILHARALNRRLRAKGSPTSVVSVCPAWVSTNIGGFATRAIGYVGAYAADGVGINSALNAMFLPGLGSSETRDFVNQGSPSPIDVFPKPGSVSSSWFRAWRLRQLVVDLLASYMLLQQRFTYRHESVKKSSLESYNRTIQESLYEWSKTQIEKWSD